MFRDRAATLVCEASEVFWPIAHGPVRRWLTRYARKAKHVVSQLRAINLCFVYGQTANDLLVPICSLVFVLL